LPSAYRFCTEWIAENEHEHILAVVSPGIKTRATPAYRDVLPMIPSHVDTLITSKMKSVLTPVLQQLKPDIILCLTFAHKLDAELCKIPTYRVVNIHPSVLERQEIPTSTQIIHQNTKADALFFIESGRLSAYSEQGGTAPIRLETMLEGSTFGEVDFYLGRLHTTTVMANEPSIVYRLSSDALAK
jgi:hypothetical protein